LQPGGSLNVYSGDCHGGDVQGLILNGNYNQQARTMATVQEEIYLHVSFLKIIIVFSIDFKPGFVYL